jgi:hypothetical protein
MGLGARSHDDGIASGADIALGELRERIVRGIRDPVAALVGIQERRGALLGATGAGVPQVDTSDDAGLLGHRARGVVKRGRLGSVEDTRAVVVEIGADGKGSGIDMRDGRGCRELARGLLG